MLAVCTTILASWTCAAPDGAPPRSTRTVVGDTTFVNNVIDAANPVPVWRLLEDLRIGARGGDGSGVDRLPRDATPVEFSGIAGIAVDADGRIYVLDRPAHEVRLFDGSGDFIRTIGRAGEGPGEFGNPLGIALDPSGRIWVRDNSRGLAVFDTSGTHLVDLLEPRVPWLGVFGADGARYEPGDVYRRPGEVRRFTTRVPAASILSLGTVARRTGRVGVDSASAPRDGMSDTSILEAPRDTIWLPWQKLPFVGLDRTNALLPGAFIPHSRLAGQAADPHGFVWWAWNDSYEIERVSFDDSSVLIVTLNRRPMRIGDVERDSIVERLLGAGSDDPDIVPRFKPLIGGLFVDTEARLWVLRYGAGPEGREGPARFDVFGRDGTFIAEAEAPTIPYGLEAITDGHVYTVELDELDVPQVVRLRIVRD